ncbi:MAG: hypothetical protein K2W96_23955, partial [Gemmataceae bacterium]|nr:hypothetical protein [Gemmataceae bacterium]
AYCAAGAGGVQALDAATGEPLGERRPFSLGGTTHSLDAHPDGRTLAVGQVLAGRWDLGSGEQVGVPLRHREAVSALRWSPCGRLLLAGTRDGTARLWHPASGKAVGPALLHAGPVTDAAWSRDGRLAGTATWGMEAKVWPAPSRMEGDVARRIEALTGTALGDDGILRDLKAEEWRERR